MRSLLISRSAVYEKRIGNGLGCSFSRTVPSTSTNGTSRGTPGSGRMIALCTKPNCAADPPIPKARASTIVADDSGLRAKNRKAKRMSAPTESIQRAGRASRASS